MNHCQTFWKKIKKRPSLDFQEIQKAFDFANKAHTGQKRYGGEDFITHPIAVAEIVSDLGGDTKSIVAALLHDVVEDTARSIEDIDEYFGDEISFLVMSLTKLSKEHFPEMEYEKRKTESLRKCLTCAQKDVRIAIIKIADRLHNMRTLDKHPYPERRKCIAQETLDTYIPIAGKLGMNQLKAELENLVKDHISTDIQKKPRRKKCLFSQEISYFSSLVGSSLLM